MQIKKMGDGVAIAVNGDKKLEVKTPFVSDLKSGDWVLVNANLVLKKITVEEAEEIKKYYDNEK